MSDNSKNGVAKKTTMRYSGTMTVTSASAADLLKTARARSGFTQAELARRAGTGQGVISAYERGKRQPTLLTLAALIGAAGFDIELTLRKRRPARGAGSPSPASSASSALRGGGTND